MGFLDIFQHRPASFDDMGLIIPQRRRGIARDMNGRASRFDAQKIQVVFIPGST